MQPPLLSGQFRKTQGWSDYREFTVSSHQHNILCVQFGDSPQALVDGLFSQDQTVRLMCTRLVGLLEDNTTTIDLVYEVVVTLGSFAHGTADNVTAILSTRALPLLINGLSHTNPPVQLACIRTLRTLYSSGLAPPSPVFDDIIIAKQLVSLLSGPTADSQCAAVVLSKACQSRDHQNLLCSLGAIPVLTDCIKSGTPKSVHSSLCCLSAMVYENSQSARLVTNSICDGHSLVSVISKVLTSNHTNESKLAAAQCLIHLCRADALPPDSPMVTLKALPSLMRLCKGESPVCLRAPAISTLAYLIGPYQSLQELSAESDRLIPTLVEYLSNRPDVNDELVTQEHINDFERLCEAVFLALGSLASSREEIRIKVASEPNCLKMLSRALRDGPSHVRVAAGRCLHSLTRSTKLLRTSLMDCEAWKPCLDMLSLSEEKLLTVATGVMCNLLLAFSPSREKLVEGGIVERLSVLSFHENPTIQVNAVWAIMSVTYDCNEDIRERVIKSFGFQRIFQLCAPCLEPKLTMKALGILINIIHNSEEAESVIRSHGDSILAAMAILLTENPSNEIGEQVLCVLVNLCSSSTKGRDLLINSDDIMRCIIGLLHHNDSHSVLLAACRIVKNLADSAFPDHIHRQNCMEEYGVKIALQKLEKKDKLQPQVKEALEHFMSHSL